MHCRHTFTPKNPTWISELLGVANQGVGGLIKNGFKTMGKHFSGKNLNKD